MRLSEISNKSSKTLSPEELRVKAMSDQAKRLQRQAQQERARQALNSAQQRMSKAINKTRSP